eukprot:3333837-Prymnesium_polylepis.1
MRRSSCCAPIAESWLLSCLLSSGRRASARMAYCSSGGSSGASHGSSSSAGSFEDIWELEQPESPWRRRVHVYRSRPYGLVCYI